MRATVLLFALTAAVPTAATAAPVIGSPAPALPTVDVRVDHSPVPPAKIRVVEFFATWCGPCHRGLRDTVAVIQELNRETKTPSIQLVVVDVGESEDTVRHWFAGFPLGNNVSLTADPDHDAYKRWGVDRLPTVFVVDEAGVIRHINRGHGKGYRARLTQWLRKRISNNSAQSPN